MATVIYNKVFLRKEALKIRKELYLSGEISKISKEIVSKIISSNVFKKSYNIALYYPIYSEINLLDLLKEKKDNRSYYFPKCENENLCFVKYTNGFFKGAYNIPEPIGEKIDPNKLDLIIVPALMANTSLYRLGYGKGYYDKFFNQNPTLRAKKVIIVPDILINDKFKNDEFDHKCDIVLSEKNILF